MMSPLELMLTIVAMGVVTFGLRFSLIILSGRVRIPLVVRRGLRYVPPAVFAAIIFPDVVRPGGTLDLSVDNPFLAAGLAAVVAARLSGNVFITVVVGMGVLWLFRWLIG